MEKNHIFQILWGSDPVVKLTLLLLLAMSVTCWAIIVYKYKEIGRLRDASRRFLDGFLRAGSVEEMLTKSSSDQPFANIFRQAAAILFHKPSGQTARPTDSSLDGIRRRIHRASEAEVERIERYLPFLATTGSTAPFIGLFGTVWGILAAFWQIGKAGSSSLAVVGPFIAEALIATAFGLAAAIPAVIFYNIFVGKTRIFAREIETFGDDLAARIARDYFKA